MHRASLTVVLAVLLAALALPAGAQTKVAVIDVQRVVTESDPGKEVLQRLKVIQEQKIEEGRAIQLALDELEDRFKKQRFTLTEVKLEELTAQIQDKRTELDRFQEDAQRELDAARRKALEGLESKIMPIINQLGDEEAYTLIFNAHLSGLVYADDAVDITDDVIRRFNLAQ